jgi:hypothetical protein
MPLIQLTYVSTAARPLASTDLSQILESSRKNNGVANVTGLLLYANTHFIQALEGEENAVMQTYARIRKDERHGSLLTISREVIVERQFPTWTMGFKHITTLDPDLQAGFNDILNEPLNDAFFSNHPTRAKRLLRLFLEKAKS